MLLPHAPTPRHPNQPKLTQTKNPNQPKRKHKLNTGASCTLQAFGGAFGKIVDVIIKPFKPVADALAPVIDTVIAFLRKLSCPPSWCFKACIWKPRKGCPFKCSKCVNVCPVKSLCDVKDLILKALDWVTDTISAAIGGTLELILKPLLEVCVGFFFFCPKVVCSHGARRATHTRHHPHHHHHH